MTEYEAIKNIKDILDEAEEQTYDDEYDSSVCYIDLKKRKCLEMAIGALKKQVTNKPTKKESVYPIYDSNWNQADAECSAEYHCPVCGECVGLDDGHFNYCCVCGQAIDWKWGD